MAEVDSSTGRRLEGLDSWRVALMLGGLLLHGSLWQQPRPLFDAIALISHSFRMGSFFAISGFLCGTSLLRRPPRQWLARRVAQIGLPTLFGWGLICPLLRVLAGVRWTGDQPMPLMFDWHHVWFLVALLLYAPFAVLVDALDRRHRLIERFAASFCTARSSALPPLLAVAASSFILMATAAMLVGALAPDRYLPMLSQCRMIAGYLPDYLFGFAVARSPGLRGAVQRSWCAPVAIVILTAAVYAAWLIVLAPMLGPDARTRTGDFVVLIGGTLCPPAVFFLIFRSAAGMSRASPLQRRLCDASLTMYLLHVPLLVAINLALAPIGLGAYLQFAIAVPAAGLLSYAIHRIVVRPVPLMMLIVNGRLDRWRRPVRGSVDEPGHHLAVRTADLHLSA